MKLHMTLLSIALVCACSSGPKTSTVPKSESKTTHPASTIKPSGVAMKTTKDTISPATIKTKSDTTRYFIEQKQRDLHMKALYLLEGLVLDETQYRPCQVTMKTKGQTHTRTLTYDTSGRLTGYVTTTKASASDATNPAPSQTTTQITYDERNLIKSVKSGVWNTTYTYEGDALKAVGSKRSTPKQYEPDRIITFTHDRTKRSIELKESVGDEAAAPAGAISFDEKGRILSGPNILNMSGMWTYSAIKEDSTHTISHMPFSELQHIHTIKSNQLIHTKSIAQVGDKEQTYVYNNGVLASSAISAIPKFQAARTMAYTYSCSK